MAGPYDDRPGSGSVESLIARHRLEPHPEGGWYRRVIESGARLETSTGERPALTSILYLLEAGGSSRPHRVVNDEVWHFLGGAPLVLAQYEPETGYRETVLGEAGVVVHCVPGSAWQAAASLGPWSLTGCTVAPGFDFADFEIAGGAALEALLLAAPAMARFAR